VEALLETMQNECRRRASRKLAATLSLCPDLEFPTQLSLEQCTADAVADFHARFIAPGSSILDMTCGLGIDTFHMARCAAAVTAIDLNPTVAAAAARNAARMGLANVETLSADSGLWLAEQSADARWDAIFIDPARRGASGQRLFGLADCSPDVTALLPTIAAHTRRLLIKASPMLDLTRVMAELPQAVAIYAVGTTSECKELFIDVSFDADSDSAVEIHAITLGHESFSYRASEPTAARIAQAAPRPGDIVGEPYPSVMKITPRGALSGEQLHVNTHIYLNPTSPWPGRLYEVERVEPFSSSTLRSLAREGVEASVAVRNLPISADDLRRRLRARESSERRLLALTAATGRWLLFLKA
jgi:hypothetical protein